MRNSFTKNYLLILICDSLEAIGGGLYLVFFPLYFIELGGTPEILGLLGSLIMLIFLVTKPIGGFLADFYGRKYVVAVPLLLEYCIIALYAFARNWYTLLILILIASLLDGVVGPARRALIADSLPKGKETVSLQVLRTMPRVLRMITPSVAGYIVAIYGIKNGVALGALVAASLGVVSAILYMLLIVETVKPSTIKKLRDLVVKPYVEAVAVLKRMSSSVLLLAFSSSIISLAFSITREFWVVYAKQIKGISPESWGLTISFERGVLLIFSIPLGWLIDVSGPLRSLIFLYFIQAFSVLFFAYGTEILPISIGRIVFMFSFTLASSAMFAYFTKIVERKTRGRFFSSIALLSSLISLPGSFIGGMLYSLYPSLPFLTQSILSILASITLIPVIIKEKVKIWKKS